MKQFNNDTLFRVSSTKSIPFKTIREISVQSLGVERVYQVIVKADGSNHIVFSSPIQAESMAFFEKLHDMIGDFITVDDVLNAIVSENAGEGTTESVEGVVEEKAEPKTRTRRKVVQAKE